MPNGERKIERIPPTWRLTSLTQRQTLPLRNDKAPLIRCRAVVYKLIKVDWRMDGELAILPK